MNPLRIALRTRIIIRDDALPTAVEPCPICRGTVEVDNPALSMLQGRCRSCGWYLTLWTLEENP